MITCSLTPSQIEKLYALAYGKMKASLNSNTTFDPNAFIQDIFQKIAEKKSNQEAVKFVQPLPVMMFKIARREEFENLDISLDSLKDLVQAVQSPEFILQTYSQFENLADVIAEVEEADQQVADQMKGNLNDDPVINPSFRFKTSSLFSGTIMEFEPTQVRKPGDVYIEQLDENLVHIFNTFARLSKVMSESEAAGIPGVTMDGVSVMLKVLPFRSDEMKGKWDGTTAGLFDKLINAKKGGKFPKALHTDQVRVMVLSDDQGNILFFDQQGNITTEEVGGKAVYQFMRPVSKNAEGKFVSTDLYGVEERVYSAAEMAKKTYTPDLNMTFEEYVSELETELQEAYKELQDLQKSVTEENKPLLPIVGVTAGVSNAKVGAIVSLNKLIQTSDQLNPLTIYSSLDKLDKPVGSFKPGVSTVRINNNTIALSRPNASRALAEEIADLLLDPNISVVQKKAYHEQFFMGVELVNNELTTDHPNRSHYILTRTTDPEYLSIVLFNETYQENPNRKASDKTARVNYNISQESLQKMTPEQKQSLKDLIVEKIAVKGKSALSKTGEKPTKHYGAAISLRKENLKGFQRYNSATQTLEPASYVEFLQELDIQANMSEVSLENVNASVMFALPSKFVNEIKQVEEELSKLNKKDENIEDSFDKAIEEARSREEANKTPGQKAFESIYTVEASKTLDPSGTLAFRTVQSVENYILRDTSGEVDKQYALDMLAAYASAFPAETKTVEILGDKINKKFPDDPADKPSSNQNSAQEGDILNLFGGEAFRKITLPSDAVTSEQIAAAKKWWSTSPLSKHIEFEHMVNITNSDAFARFLVAGTKLLDGGKLGRVEIFQNGNMVDVYHEAWHVFSQLYLTKDQKTKLYNEIKASDPKYKNMSFLEIEEELAEDFRSYAKNPKPKKNAPVRNSLFRKIMNFLRSLFGKTTTQDIASTDLTEMPVVKDLFEKLYFANSNPALLNQYNASLDNVMFDMLNRGVQRLPQTSGSSVLNKDFDVLSKTDSDLVVQTIDAIISAKADEYVKLFEQNNKGNKNLGAPIGLLSTAINPATGVSYREMTFQHVKVTLQEQLKKFKAELGSVTQVPFDSLKTKKDLENNAVAIYKITDKDGKFLENKYVFLSSQIDSLNSLTPNLKKGDRVKGQTYNDINIISDTFIHNTIQERLAKNADIIVVDSLEDAVSQFEAYKKASNRYSDIELKTTPEIKPLTPEQQTLFHNIKILETTLAHFGDTSNKKGGVLKYYGEHSAYKAFLSGKDVVEVEYDEQGEEIDEASVEASTTDSQLQDKEVGKKSRLELAKPTTIYILRSLFKMQNGKVVNNRLGFPELADFGRIWALLSREIQGITDPQKMYDKIKELAKENVELEQLIKYKLANPAESTSDAEFDIMTSFYQSFSKPEIDYTQTTIIQTEEGDYIARVTDASVETSSLREKFSYYFKTKSVDAYTIKTDNNVNILNIQKVVSSFGRRGTLTKNEAFTFLRAIGFQLDDLTAIKEDIALNYKDYGIEYLYSIVQSFAELDKAPEKTKLQKEYLIKFKTDPVKTLYDEIPKGVFISGEFQHKKTKQANNVKAILEVQGKYGVDIASSGVLNAAGDRVYPVINIHSISRITQGLNETQSLNALPRHLESFDPKINSFVNRRRSRIMSSLFMPGTVGERNPGTELKLAMASGLQIIPNDNTPKIGLNTTDLTLEAKFIQEFHSMLRSGVQELPRHASKASSFYAKITGGIEQVLGLIKDSNLYVATENFNSENLRKGNFKTALAAISIPHLAAEFERIQKFKNNSSEYLKNTAYSRKVKDSEGKEKYTAELFTAFDNVLTSETKTKLYNLYEKGKVQDLEVLLQKNPELKNEVLADIETYFKDLAKENLEMLNEAGYVDETLFIKTGLADPITEKVPDNKKEEAIKTLVLSYTFNSWVHNFEVANLFYGDMVQYNHAKEELHKRNTGSTSGGETFRVDTAAIQFINNTFLPKGYGKPFVFDGTLTTGVIKDANKSSVYLKEIEKGLREDYIKSYTEKGIAPAKYKTELEDRIKKEMKAYGKMTEADGAGYISFDAYRVLKKLENDWTPQQESLFQKVKRNEKVEAAQIVEFFPVYKLQYFGPMAQSSIPVTGMHKFALMPLIPNVIAGTDLEKLHNKMMNDGVQYVTFESGSKVNIVTKDGNPDNPFTDTDNKNFNENFTFTPNVIHLEYLKNVTTIKSKYKTNITYPTQLRGIILDGLYNNGKPVSKEAGQAGDEYQKAVKDLSKLLEIELLDEINYKYDPVTKKYSGDITRLLEVAKEELGKKGLPEHHLKYLAVSQNGTLANDLSLHIQADDVEKIIMSLIEKRLVKQKIYGEALIQVPATFWNNLWDTRQVKTPEEVREYMGSNNLPFYRKDANGKTKPMKIAIALQGEFVRLLKAKHNDGNPIETIERLNDMIKDDTWLSTNKDSITLNGVRIPTQGLNSIEMAEVYHFLPASAGSLVVVPTEIVAKAGSDFDVDKIFWTYPHITKDGQFLKSELTVEALEKKLLEAKTPQDKKNIKQAIQVKKAALENALISTAKGILELPENYATLVRPNETYLTKDTADKLEEYATEYDRFANKHGKPKTKRISPTRTLEPLYNGYKHQVNLTGKTALGIMALQNKIHPIIKSVGGVVPITYEHPSFPTGMKRKLNIRLPHNQDAQGRPVVGENLNVDGIRIADVNSHTMNGQLDVEKDAWVFNIQADPETTPMLAALTEMGMSPEKVFYFVSNPLVKEYKKLKRELTGPLAVLKGLEVNFGVNYTALNTILSEKLSSQLTEALTSQAKAAYIRDIFTQLKGQSIKVKYNDPATRKLITLNDAAFEAIAPYINNITEISVETDQSLRLFSNTSFSIASNAGYAYASDIVYRNVKKDEPFFTLQELKDSAENKADFKMDLAIFLNYLEMEKGLSDYIGFKRMLNPDTKVNKTVFQKYKNNVQYRQKSELSGVDRATAERLRNKSVLSSFFSNNIALDIVTELFPLRLNKEVNRYLMDVLTDQRTANQIRRAWGKGVDGQEFFTSNFNNGLVNFIYQNSLSNFMTDTGLITSTPDRYKTYSVQYVKNKVDNPSGILFTENAVIVNQEQLSSVFSTDEKIKALFGLISLKTTEVTKSRLTRYLFEKEYLAQTKYTSVEQLENNPLFQKIKAIYGEMPGSTIEESNAILLDTFISQKALLNVYDRGAMMLDPTLSYSALVMDIIEQFPELSNTYPILEQLQIAEFPIKRGVYVLTLKNKKEMDENLAQTYEQNLRQLADHNVLKVNSENKQYQADVNAYISNLFQQFSLAMLYQHGFGFSSFGFNKAINGDRALNIMRNNTIQFTSRVLSNSSTASQVLNVVYGKVLQQKQRETKFTAKHHNNFLASTSDYNIGIPPSALPTVDTEETGPITPTQAPVSQTNKPKGEQVKEGIYVNQGALTKEEQLELFNYLKPFLEEQAAKTNKGNQASKMIGLGLRWDYKNNNVGRQSVEIPDVINPGNKTKYGYYDQSINGQPLGQITPRFRELMQKATGVDMTNYDGAIINLYEKDTFISSHNDVDESKSAIKYPVIGINLGGKGNFSIERLGPENAMLDLEAGTGYVFGVDGINREVWHRTFPTPQDSFLPELTTKIDGKTYPAGSYRVTITMRRVMPLAQGMPQAPSIVSETQAPVSTTNNPAEFTNYHGGAKKYDTYWEQEGKGVGVTKHTVYTTDSYDALDETTKEKLEARYQSARTWLGRGNVAADSYSGKLVRRDMMQAAKADGIFAISEIVAPGTKGRKGYVNKTNHPIIEGGTGYAVASGILLGKPVYVFNQDSSYGYDTGWYKWDSTANNFVKTDTPVLTKNYAGIGSHTYETEIGRQAIKDVYANTFKATTQPTVEPVGEVKEGVAELFQSNPELASQIYEAAGFEINTVEKNIENTVTEVLKEKIFRIGTIPFEKTEFEDINVYVKKKNDDEFSIAVDNKGRNIFGLVSAVLDFQRRDLESNSIYAPNPKGFILWETFLKSEIASTPKAKVIVDNRFSIALGALKALKNNGIEYIHFPEKFAEDFKKEYSQFLKQDFSSVGFTDVTDVTLKTIQISIDDLIRIINLKSNKQELTPQQKQEAQQLYSQYLDTIFPDSKVKDIVVHLSRVPNIEKFKINDNTQGNFINSQVLGSGVYFASPDSIDYWSMELGFIDDITGAYTKNRNIYFAILNSKFPEEFQKNYIDDIDVKEGTDVVINQSRITGKREEYVVKNPDIIHILGSKQDIEGFKEFVQSKSKDDLDENGKLIVPDSGDSC